MISSPPLRLAGGQPAPAPRPGRPPRPPARPRLRPGMPGALASVRRLGRALADLDIDRVAAVLADACECLGGRASEHPGPRPDLASVERLLGGLRDEVRASNRPCARSTLSLMLARMGQRLYGPMA